MAKGLCKFSALLPLVSLMGFEATTVRMWLCSSVVHCSTLYLSSQHSSVRCAKIIFYILYIIACQWVVSIVLVDTIYLLHH